MNAVLQAKNLSKIYGRGESEVRALNRCDLTFEEGGFTAIVGRSGSGKTTLLHLLGGLDMPTTGTVLLEGRDIYALSDKQRTILRRRRIGFVFQFYNLVPELTAWQNIVLPLNLDGRRPDAEYLNAVVEPLGLTERLGHFAGELSGGDDSRRIYVTLGQFSIVRLERDTQLLVPVYDYCMPDKECACGDGCEDPCALFRNISFPVGEFFPPNTVKRPESCDDIKSCCK